jgi:hypothetical protein
MPEIHRQKEWQNLQKLGLCPGIRTFEDYVNGVRIGEARAGLLILLRCQKFPTPNYIRELHRAMFIVEGEDVWFGGMLRATLDISYAS